MDNVPVPPAPTPDPAPQPPQLLCPQCHQPVTPTEYYCPNCGKKLGEPPLSTSFGAQLWLYAFSVILPFIGWLAITKWEGIKYARSDDPKAQQIGWIAIALLAICSIYVTWQLIDLGREFIQAETSTAGLSQYGF